MKLTKGLIILLCFSSVLRAQNMLPQQMDTSKYKGTVIFSGVAGFGTTALNNTFSKTFIQGGHLSRDLVLQQLDQHKGINRFGVEIAGQMDYHNYELNFFKKANYGLVLRTGYNSYLSSNYTQDAFGLVFQGNAAYTGDTLRLSGSELSGVSFQKFGLGFVNKKTKSSFVLNGYNVSSYQDLFIRQGDFYTDSNAQRFYVNLAGKWESTTGANFHQGWGIGLDLDYRLPVEWFNGDTAYIQLMANNIGFMQINRAEVYRIDREISYEGYSISNWMNFANSSDSAMTSFQDSVGLDVRQERVFGILPGFFQVGKLINERDTATWQSYFGIRKYIMRAYNPLIFIGFQYRASSWLQAGIQGSYGGFSTFKAGAYLQGSWNTFHFGVGSEDLIGLVSGRGKGQNLYLRCVYRW